MDNSRRRVGTGCPSLTACAGTDSSTTSRISSPPSGRRSGPRSTARPRRLRLSRVPLRDRLTVLAEEGQTAVRVVRAAGRHRPARARERHRRRLGGARARRRSRGCAHRPALGDREHRDAASRSAAQRSRRRRLAASRADDARVRAARPDAAPRRRDAPPRRADAPSPARSIAREPTTSTSRCTSPARHDARTRSAAIGSSRSRRSCGSGSTAARGRSERIVRDRPASGCRQSLWRIRPVPHSSGKLASFDWRHRAMTRASSARSSRYRATESASIRQRPGEPTRTPRSCADVHELHHLVDRHADAARPPRPG